MGEIKYSIIIPTFNRGDLLLRCIESIKENTYLMNVEVIVVCNGCQDNSVSIVEQQGPPFKYIYHPQRVGFARAVNLGVSLAQGEYIILLNNDAILLGPQWIDLLEQPFKLDSKCGITGPAAAPRGGHIWIVFFCAMIRASLFREVGLLDPIFGIGAGEDTDFGIKVSQLGYHNYQVPIDAAPLVITDDDPDVSRGDFPLWHPGGATCSNIPEFKEAVLANTELLDRKYGK